MPGKRKTLGNYRFWRLLVVILWVAAALPRGSALADITYDDGATHTVNSDISDAKMTVGATPAGAGTTLGQSAYLNTLSGTLTLGQDTGSSGLYNLTTGSLAAAVEIIGYSGSGTFTQSGGTLSYDTLNFQGGDYTGDLVNQNLITGTMNGNLVNAGTVSPGNSPGTLTINGSYTQTAAGTYQAEIASATSYDQINVSGNPGTASLNGTLALSLLNGYRPQGNQVFSIITATGGLTGTFSSIINQQIALTLFWQPHYYANSVELWVQRDYSNLTGLTANQRSVGNMLNSVGDTATGDLNYVLNAMDNLPTYPAPQTCSRALPPPPAWLSKKGANTKLPLKRCFIGADPCVRPGGWEHTWVLPTTDNFTPMTVTWYKWQQLSAKSRLPWWCDVRLESKQSIRGSMCRGWRYISCHGNNL
jgi:hypothetical protein